jgi:hypothetical protein
MSACPRSFLHGGYAMARVWIVSACSQAVYSLYAGLQLPLSSCVYYKASLAQNPGAVDVLMYSWETCFWNGSVVAGPTRDEIASLNCVIDNSIVAGLLAELWSLLTHHPALGLWNKM